MSSFNHSNNTDNLLLQTLLGRLQIRPPTNPFLSQSLEDLLLSPDGSLSDDESDHNHTQLAREESKLEKEIIRIIISGRSDSLKPNSGQAVTINDHHICVGYHEDEESDYRVWEWHGHIMLFDGENGYSPEYIYGNYFERSPLKMPGGPAKKKEEKKDEEVRENLGLRELIDEGESAGGRILHRNINSSRTDRV